MTKTYRVTAQPDPDFPNDPPEVGTYSEDEFALFVRDEAVFSAASDDNVLYLHDGRICTYEEVEA